MLFVIFSCFTFALLFIHFYLIEVRGGSVTLEYYLIGSAFIALLLTMGLSHWKKTFFEARIKIVSAAALSAAFFVVWAVLYVLAEESYIFLHNENSRRIYNDDSAMAYAEGFKSLPALTPLFGLFGLFFGGLFGIVATVFHATRRWLKSSSTPP